MKRQGALIVLTASVMATIPSASGAGLGPTPVRYVGEYPPPAGYSSGTVPEILRRTGEILGAIDSPQRRSELAEQWLQYSKQIIAKEQEYRQQWLDFQRQHMAQQQQMEELRLEVAQLQMQIEELRAQNARLERENLLSHSKLGQTSRDRTAREPAPPSSTAPGSARPRPGQTLWSLISALLFGAKPPTDHDKDAPP